MSERCHAERGRRPEAEVPLDLARIRERLASASGPEYWRSLDEIADTPAFREYLGREFPSQASEWTDPVGRRRFLQLMAASLALAGVGACTKQPPEDIVPYVRQPEEIVPGRPRFFATAMTLSGVATGLLVESHMGRPTKVEGNPDHPASLGATDAIAQASILTLYDPDRSQTLTHLGDIRPWSAFLGTARGALLGRPTGAGFRILTESAGSPTLEAQIAELLEALPEARRHHYEPVTRDNVHSGMRLAFGEPLEPQYRIEEADVILALDADFLACGPGSLRHARAFADRRRAMAGEGRPCRLYAVESTPSLTGSRADHRLALRPSQVEAFTRRLAASLGIAAAGPGDGTGLSEPARRFADAVRADLAAHPGSCLVVAGEAPPPVVHTLAAAINEALGNTDRTVGYADPPVAPAVDHLASLRELTAEMNAGAVGTLLVLGGNPVFTAPADLDFARVLSRVELRVHLSLYNDETSALCHWHVPEAHYLEAWSDGRAFDGTASIVQPLIAPLYGGRSAHEVLAAFTDRPERSGRDIVRDFWRQRFASAAGAAPGSAGRAAFERFWRKALHDGVVPDTAHAPRQVSLRRDLAGEPARPREGDNGLEIVFRPDPTIYDGRFANNGWLQELPKPLTKITWDNVAMLSPATAGRLGVAREEVVRLRYREREIEAPVWIVPGHADETVTVHLGYGRTRAGRAGTGAGFDAYRLRTSDAPWFGTGLQIERTGRRHAIAATQSHHTMEGRRLVRVATLEEFQQHPEFAKDHEGEPPSLLAPHPYPGYAWGMAIDIDVCTGCNACVAACQAENNIPVVGKDQVARGREMHWLRVDTYHRGSLENPETYHQPVPCMHCENAPCEVVCPVGATVHSSEGLNDMVYNRCVGTRYCSNNCPYKVRRFNFLLFQDWTTASLELMRNPDVSVRSRGVMEKCTYCVQRINEARAQSIRDGRSIRDGEIVTACEAVCPTRAIVFGNINDPDSRVSRLKASQRDYTLLAELNTRPRTSYLAALRNPNPALGGSRAGGPHGESS